MREFHFANGTAVLNGKVIYMRGSSMTVTPLFCRSGPPSALERRLGAQVFVEIPKKMHWNAFRVCIGPPPQHWLDVADEAGLLLQYEFPVWDDREPDALQELEQRRTPYGIQRVHA